MKRKLSLLSVVFVMAMGAYFATNGTTSQKNDLLNKNIEAFSDPQGPIGNNAGKCYSEYAYSNRRMCLICYKCTFVPGRGTRQGGTCGQ